MAMLALIPLWVGAGLTLLLMWLLGLPFNQANVLFLPLILGEGVEFGIIILTRWQLEDRPGPSRCRPAPPKGGPGRPDHHGGLREPHGIQPPGDLQPGSPGHRGQPLRPGGFLERAAGLSPSGGEEITPSDTLFHSLLGAPARSSYRHKPARRKTADADAK